MSTEQIKYEVDLIGGAKNVQAKDGAPHRHVVFGYRITGADLFRVDTDPQAKISTQYEDLILREAIVEFGSLPQPASGKLQVPLSLLLDLDSIDREDLTAAHNQFQAISQGDRKPVMMPPDKVKLMFGFTIGEQTYDLVQFGRRLTGRDEVAADKQGLTGIARMCYRAGQQISQVAIACEKCLGVGSVEGKKTCAECKGAGWREGSEVEGPIDLEFFKTLDGADIQIVGAGAELWRQSFRLRGGSVPGNGKSADGAAAGNENRVDGGSAAPAAGGAA